MIFGPILHLKLGHLAVNMMPIGIKLLYGESGILETPSESILLIIYENIDLELPLWTKIVFFGSILDKICVFRANFGPKSSLLGP